MDQGRTKPDKDVFLSTADIIHRVALAQAHPVSRWMGSMRLYVVLGLSLFMGIGVVVMAWRTFCAPPYAQEDVAQNPGLEGAPQDGGLPPQDDEAPAHSSRARPAAPKAGAAGVGASAPAPLHVGSQLLKVIVLHQAGAMWLDGKRVADKKHTWSGHVAPGKHQLAVRIGSRIMRHIFVVEDQPMAIVVDPFQESFRVSVGHTGHHVGRSRSH